MRVGEKEDGHAKIEKWKFACQGKKKTGRRCMKCASRRQRRGNKESSRKRVPPCYIREMGAMVTSRERETGAKETSRHGYASRDRSSRLNPSARNKK